MIVGSLGSHAEMFLRVVTIGTVVAFAIPIFVAPMTWARLLKWEVGTRPDLALYFGTVHVAEKAFLLAPDY